MWPMRTSNVYRLPIRRAGVLDPQSGSTSEAGWAGAEAFKNYRWKRCADIPVMLRLANADVGFRTKQLLTTDCGTGVIVAPELFSTTIGVCLSLGPSALQPGQRKCSVLW